MNYCPLVNSECIKRNCVAYKVKMNYVKCDSCDNVYELGLRCSNKEHKSHHFHHVDAYCKHFNINLKPEV